MEICDSMTYQRNQPTKSKRISLTLSEEELTQWGFFNTRESLSAFIREAVNFYIQTLEKEQADLKPMQDTIDKNHTRIEKIEGDLLEIQAVLAKHNILLETDVLERRIIDFITKICGCLPCFMPGRCYLAIHSISIML